MTDFGFVWEQAMTPRLTAERFQFTVGQGPCIEAHASARPVLAPDAVLGFR
jgi:hypothetical protein